MNSLEDKLRNLWTSSYEKRLFFDFWECHLHWLDGLGWKLAQKRGTYDPPSIPSNHRTIEYLREFISLTGKVNAHFCLTSSDVEDNILKSKVSRSLAFLEEMLHSFVSQMIDCSSSTPEAHTIAYTHLLPAGIISWKWRFRAWTTPLLLAPPPIHGKFLAGPTGDFMEFKHAFEIDPVESQLRFPWEKFDLRKPINPYPLQSSDYQDEATAAGWIAQMAGCLHKIACDWRILYGFGHLEPSGTVSGSSSIPDKRNPIKWEKACSIARSLLNIQGEINNVYAHNHLERTLDTSWQLRKVLCESCLRLGEIIILLSENLPRLVPQKPSGSGLRLSDERRKKTKQVLSGISRCSLYDSLTIQNQSK